MRRDNVADLSADLHEQMKQEDERESVPPRFSDDSLANDFTARHGQDLRYVPAWGKYLWWDGLRWAEDRALAVFELVRIVCRDAASRAGKIARQIASAKTVAAVERIIRRDPRHVLLPEQLDADDYLLNTPGGTVDLRSGEIRPHRREDLLTKLTRVALDDHADDSVWRRFLRDITCSDSEFAAYLQRLLGYMLTGDTRDHVLAFFFGTGANGKSTLLDLVLYLLGDYARQVPSETLMESRGDRHPTEIANLMGVRLAVSSELEEGQHWAEARIKALTGDAVLSARFMRQDFFEFRRTHKHIIAGNHKPAVRAVDDAIRRRIHLLPFTARFSGDRADRDMPTKLRAEGPAILAWMIRGCIEWQLSGLCPPSTVTSATDDYLAMQDTLGLWLDENCDTSDPTVETRSGELYANFTDWKYSRGERAPSQVRFTAQLEQRFRRERDTRTGHMIFHGVRLK
jgi:putative DNA primase/helicase